MFTKVKKGFAKRIAAFMMAMLMVFSLMPIDASIFLAEEATYVFQVKDAENNAIIGANFTFYDAESAEVELGENTVSYNEETQQYSLTIDTDVVAIASFLVSAEGYISCEAVPLTEATEYNITLEKRTSVTVTGKIVLPTAPEEGETGAYADVNVVLLDEAGDAVVAEEVEITADVNDDDGTYSFANVPVGAIYTVKITSKNNVYATKEFSVDLTSVDSETVEIEENDNSLVVNNEVEISFENDQIFVAYIKGTTRTFYPTVKSGETVIGSGYTITYNTNAEGIEITADGNNLVVKALENAPVGTITITAEFVDADGVGYVTTTKEIQIEIKAKEPYAPFNFTNGEITDDGVADIPYTTDEEYRFDASSNVNAESVVIGDSITYSVEDESVAEIDSNGQIAIKKVGTTEVFAEYAAAEGADYTTNKISFILNVTSIEQEYDVVFDEATNEALEPNGGTLTKEFGQNNTYEFPAKTLDPEMDKVTITYSVTDENRNPVDVAIANIDENGTFTCTVAGTYIVTATASKPNYIDETVEYIVVINKADPGLYFATDVAGYEENVINGKYLLNGFDFTEAVLKSTVGADVKSGIRYTTQSDLITINESTGVITFKELKNASVGTVDITITATWEGDASYQADTATYTFKVGDWTPIDAWEDIYSITQPNENGWYAKVDAENPITIDIKDGKEYQIFMEVPTKDTITTGVTSYDVTSLEDGDNQEISFYIMDASVDGKGYISGKHTISDIKIDSVASSICVKQGESTFLEKLLYFFKGEQEFEVEVNESLAPNKIYYYVADGATAIAVNGEESIGEAIERVVAGNWEPYVTSIIKNVNKANVIYAKVVDEAGNTAYAHTNGLITDSEVPVINVTEPETVNGYYKTDFSISVAVTEQQNLSGIQEVYYQIGSEDAQKEYLVPNTVTDSTSASELVYTTSNLPINIVANEYNTVDGVTLYIVAVDNAGNETKLVKNYKICIEEPTISVSFDNNNIKNTKDGINYYDETRTATITIDSRDDVFDTNKVIVKVNGQRTACTWNGTSASVPFSTNGKHTLSVEYTNIIGDVAEAYSETFLIDMDVPTGTANLVTDSETKTWETWLEKLTFGIWKKATATVTAIANVDTTAVTMQYHVSHTENLLTKDALNALDSNAWTDYTNGEKINCTEEDIYAVYFKLVDEVGHITYLSTDGFVVDMEGANIKLTPHTQPNTNGYYNSDVTFTISVEEKSETYSGIDTITYWVVCDGQASQKVEVYNFDITSPVYGELKNSWNEEFTITTDKYSGDNIVVYAEVKDNAGNITTTEGHALKINAIAPTVDISYDNNNATGFDGLTYYFDATRTATITITDKTQPFDEVTATNAIQVTLKDKAGNTVTDSGVIISAWKEKAEDTYVATVSFTKDGYYTIAVDYTDKSDLSNAGQINSVQSTVAPEAFVIDTADPINVSISALSQKWEEFFERITFGLYTAENVVLTITGEDVTSNTVIEYYISNDGQNLKEDDLEKIADDKWTTYTSAVTISKEQQMAVYVRVTDQAGNRVYVNTDGIVLDKTEAGIVLTPEAPNANGVYSSDVDMTISIDDTAITSGIKTVEYWITCDGMKTAHETLYTFSKNTPTKGDLLQSYSETITVDAAENNSSNVVVYVQVVDNAGNIATTSKPLDIDITAPTIEISYDNNAVADIVNDRGYFDAARTATIVVTERTNHFDKDALQQGIVITAKDSKGNNISAAVPTIVYEGTVNGNTADEAKHTFKVVYSAEANYTFDISYTDTAGCVCDAEDVDYGMSIAPKNFTVDTIAPVGTITAGELGVWESLLQTITFGLWSPSEVDIVITSDDVTSPIKNVEYYKTTTFTALSVEDLDAVTAWVKEDYLTVSSDDIFVVYAKITDQAGNVQYISTNGIIVDETKPVLETLSPEITITPERPVNGIYDGNVRVDVGVIDPKVGTNNAYSGLRTIRYEVYNMGVKTQEGTLYNFTETNPTQNKLLQSWNDEDIVVDASRNNSNDVVVKVMANDNVGNYTEKEISLQIDTTKPVIEVSYDNNNGDTTFADGVYYNANRVATIKVTERNFDAKNVNVVITNTDSVIPTISSWTTVKGTGNGDDTVHTATIVYNADGDYTFAVSAKDKGGNANNGVNYGISQAPTAFTIDKTAPVISIAYDNNEYTNENYYKADRVATITINEHNFDASRVVATITATDNGLPVTAPVISSWSKFGDTYIATVNYTSDALYTFDIEYNDKAGNVAADFTKQSFYVDKTKPQMSITEIVDQSANNKDKIGFVITATDTNFDVFNPVLTAVIKTDNGFATQELNIASISDITNGRVYTINNIDADGIYRITCTLVDKAGNAYTEVTLHQEDGTPYVEERTAEDTLLSFSVNREGSAFEVDESTKEVLDNYYVYDVTEDVVIIEVNANSLTQRDITLNGEKIEEGVDFSITTEGGNGAWMKYIYTLNKELFVEEGEYTIVVSSIDEAENNAFSDVKNAKVAFVVDRTAPVVTISGLETDGRYQTDAQTVTLIPTDDGGAVKSIVVNQVDEDGVVVKVLQEELSGDALAEKMSTNDGKIVFNIPSGEYDYIEVVCADYSVKADGNTNVSEILIKNVLITENPMEIFWATYQYVIIGGGAVAVAVPTGVVLFRRRLKLKV